MKKSLIETNPYLINEESREAALISSVISSCAVEGIVVTEEDLKKKNTPIDCNRTRAILNRMKADIARREAQ